MRSCQLAHHQRARRAGGPASTKKRCFSKNFMRSKLFHPSTRSVGRSAMPWTARQAVSSEHTNRFLVLVAPSAKDGRGRVLLIISRHEVGLQRSLALCARAHCTRTDYAARGRHRSRRPPVTVVSARQRDRYRCEISRDHNAHNAPTPARCESCSTPPTPFADFLWKGSLKVRKTSPYCAICSQGFISPAPPTAENGSKL